jgi:hypothetical protein
MTTLSAFADDPPRDAPSADAVTGEAFTPPQIASAIALGLAALLISGLMALLLGVLAEEGRISATGIGLCAMVEALSTGLVTGLAGMVLKPVRLRAVAVAATLLVAAADLATTRVSGGGVLAVRALAGLPEGILLWISIGMISRSITPERWAAALFTGMGVTALAAAAGISLFVLPRFGANGGYVALAALVLTALAAAPFLPSAFRTGPGAMGGGGAPPLRGWLALLATLCFSAPLAGVAVYVLPLAAQAHLPHATGRLAISAGLACQIAGGALATVLAGRLRYIQVFWVAGPLILGCWAVYALPAPAWLFIAATGLAGLIAMLGGPFLVPMTIEADPSRRAAMQSGAVQLLAGALGPFLGSRLVSGHDVHGVLIMGAALMVSGLVVITILHWTARS